MSLSPGTDRLYRWERLSLLFMGVLVFAFAGVIELRSCFQKTRKTDFEVYLRAAWAVREGLDIYSVTCSNRYHYTYPPAFAIVMTPFADAPKDLPRHLLIPFALSVAIWTSFNFFLVARMAHVLATIALPHELRGTRRWWYARTVPVYVAFGGVGYSIGFGQVNVLLTALLVEMLRASLESKRLQSGVWLAAAITIKVFPAYLILYPLARRDARALVGTACGLFVGLIALPVTTLGVHQTENCYRAYVANVILPGALGKESGGSVKELIDLPSNDSQSFLAVIHSNLHPVRATQPGNASKSTRLAHNLLAAGLTLATLIVIARKRQEPVDAVIACGLLMLLMLHITPMSHMHYYAFGYVLVAGLWLKGIEGRSRIFPGWRVLAPLVLWGVGTALPLFPGETFELLRYRGLGLTASMMLWAAGMNTMIRIKQTAAVEEEPVIMKFEQPRLRKAA